MASIGQLEAAYKAANDAYDTAARKSFAAAAQALQATQTSRQANAASMRAALLSYLATKRSAAAQADHGAAAQAEATAAQAQAAAAASEAESTAAASEADAADKEAEIAHTQAKNAALKVDEALKALNASDASAAQSKDQSSHNLPEPATEQKYDSKTGKEIYVSGQADADADEKDSGPMQPQAAAENKFDFSRIINKIETDTYTFNRWCSESTQIRFDTTKYSEYILDSVHDNAAPFPENKSKPGNAWDDNIVANTKIEKENLIITQLTDFGKCVELKVDSNEGQIPYSVPNNNENCYIRDCFAGAFIPGPNNLLDQAIASLESFIRQNINKDGRSNVVSPLAGQGGLGQQYAKLPPPAISNSLRFTAYFNYDLIMFLYIIDEFPPTNPLFDRLKIKITNAINTPSTSQLLDPHEIILINIINLNYLWCGLMIFCKQCIVDDPYLKVTQKEYFIKGLHILTYLRFDMFNIKDNYITSPFFYLRTNNKAQGLNEDYVGYVGYVIKLCNEIYTKSTDQSYPPFGVIVDNTPIITMAGSGISYATSQSSVTKNIIGCFIATIKAAVCRNATNSNNPLVNLAIGCSTELNNLFDEVLKQTNPELKSTPKNEIKGYAWSMLKFSGDSSHIVFGEIMEKIKAFKIGVTTPLTNLNIVYAVSERPLAARLLAVSKNVFVSNINIFMNNFNGPGVENKSKTHSALFIQFNFMNAYNNIIDNLYNKCVDALTKENHGNSNIVISELFGNYNTTHAGNKITIDDFKSAPANNYQVKLSYLKMLFVISYSFIDGNPTQNDVSDLNHAVNDNENVKNFLKAYLIDITISNIKDVLKNKVNNYQIQNFKDNFIGTRIFRADKLQWYHLMNEIVNPPEPPIPPIPPINMSDEFNSIQEFFSLINQLYLIDEKNATDFMTEINKPEYTNLKMVYDAITQTYKSFDENKYINFVQDRTNNWDEKQPTRVRDNTPYETIQQLQNFVDSCININNKLKNQKADEPASRKRQFEGESSDKNPNFVGGARNPFDTAENYAIDLENILITIPFEKTLEFELDGEQVELDSEPIELDGEQVELGASVASNSEPIKLDASVASVTLNWSLNADYGIDDNNYLLNDFYNACQSIMADDAEAKKDVKKQQSVLPNDSSKKSSSFVADNDTFLDEIIQKLDYNKIFCNRLYNLIGFGDKHDENIYYYIEYEVNRITNLFESINTNWKTQINPYIYNMSNFVDDLSKIISPIKNLVTITGEAEIDDQSTIEGNDQSNIEGHGQTDHNKFDPFITPPSSQTSPPNTPQHGEMEGVTHGQIEVFSGGNNPNPKTRRKKNNKNKSKRKTIKHKRIKKHTKTIRKY